MTKKFHLKFSKIVKNDTKQLKNFSNNKCSVKDELNIGIIILNLKCKHLWLIVYGTKLNFVVKL